MVKKSDNKNSLKVIILGGLATGQKTGTTLARRKPDADITLFQKENEISNGSCGLPYFVSGEIGNLDELTNTSYGESRNENYFKRTKGFEIITGAKVVKIDRAKKEVCVELPDSKETSIYPYDKLVLAVGSNPIPPPFPVPQNELVRSVTRPEDALSFRKKAEQGQLSRVTIIGGGLNGCEMAEAVVSMWGIDATIIEKENHLLHTVLDYEMSRLVEMEIKKQGVVVLLNSKVEKIDFDFEEKPEVSVSNNDKIVSDFVFLCLGVQPEAQLANDCGIKIGSTGAIFVNKSMQTSDPDIFAGGDCVESSHQLTKQQVYMPNSSLSHRHGRVIAENVTGNKIKFPGVLGALLVKVFDLNVGAIGLTEKAAKAAKLEYDSVLGNFSDIPDFFPKSGNITLKMVYEKKSERLLGLQAIGTGNINGKIDTFSSLLQKNGTVDDLLDFEHAYSPPYSTPADAFHFLAGMVKAKEAGFCFATAEETKELNITWLDIRAADEAESAPWPYVEDGYNHELVNIPLGDLKNRLDELDPGYKIMVFCRRGPRAYQAATVLKNAGFKNVHIISGGTKMIQP